MVQKDPIKRKRGAESKPKISLENIGDALVHEVRCVYNSFSRIINDGKMALTDQVAPIMISSIEHSSDHKELAH